MAEWTERAELLFKKEKSVSYAKITGAIYIHFSIGVNASKKILTEMKNENLIIQNGKRGTYETSRPNRSLQEKTSKR